MVTKIGQQLPAATAFGDYSLRHTSLDIGDISITWTCESDESLYLPSWMCYNN